MDQAHRLREIVKERNSQDLEAASKKINTRVISITSGKGGVGKTNFAINLAIQMSRYNKRVLIIDADFGLANIEVLLGQTPSHTFADMIIGKKGIREIITEGPMGIKYISGGSGLIEMANLTERQAVSVIDNLQYIDDIADIILLDTGAGISRTVVNFIRAATETVVITTPEPTAVTDAYALLKAVNEGQPQDGAEFGIVVNRVDDTREGTEIYDRLNKVSIKFLDKKLACLGHIPDDVQLKKAVRRQEPVAISFPNSVSARAIDSIGIKLLNMPPEKRGGPDSIISFMKRLVGSFGG
jgi:flagellar biosynthesis protein FlhG